MKRLPLMRGLLPALAIAFCVEASAQESGFTQAQLDQEGGQLWLRRANGTRTAAPSFDDQDSFGEPAVASTRRHAGWLALFPNRGASYPQPLYLVVLDTSNHVQTYRADFGMVFGWCFTPRGDAVVFRSSFPHGRTPVEYDMRRLSDGSLLRRFTIPEDAADQTVPSWASCAGHAG